MTVFEDRLQVALHDLADDVGSAPLHRWVAVVTPSTGRRGLARRTPRVATVGLAVGLAVALLVASTMLVLRPDQPAVVEPVRQPPRVVRLGGPTDSAPGAADLAFTLGRLADGSSGPAGYLVSAGPAGHAGATVATALPAERLAQPVANFTRPQLSADGRTFLVQSEAASAFDQLEQPPTMALVGLTTGRRDDLGGVRGFCPELSPDGGSVAFLDGSGVVRVLDVASRTTTVVQDEVRPDARAGCAGGIGWSPDGALLAIGRQGRSETATVDGTRVVTAAGRTVADLPGHLVNGSMSWAPDGLTLLLYTPRDGRYAIGRLDGSAPAPLDAPRDAVTAVGWAGKRVVWLLGGAGDQRLVTTDTEGGDRRPWVRLDVGDLPVASIQWSRDLTGTAAR